jgi:hypothetical protein
VLTIDNAREIDLGYDEDPLGDAYSKFWDAVNPLPVGSIVAAGWPGNLAYWRKDSDTDFRFTLVQIDGDDMPLVPGYVETSDPNTLSCGGDIEVAYVIREGA